MTEPLSSDVSESGPLLILRVLCVLGGLEKQFATDGQLADVFNN